MLLIYKYIKYILCILHMYIICAYSACFFNEKQFRLCSCYFAHAPCWFCFFFLLERVGWDLICLLLTVIWYGLENGQQQKLYPSVFFMKHLMIKLLPLKPEKVRANYCCFCCCMKSNRNYRFKNRKWILFLKRIFSRNGFSLFLRKL